MCVRVCVFVPLITLLWKNKLLPLQVTRPGVHGKVVWGPSPSTPAQTQRPFSLLLSRTSLTRDFFFEIIYMKNKDNSWKPCRSVLIEASRKFYGTYVYALNATRWQGNVMKPASHHRWVRGFPTVDGLSAGSRENFLVTWTFGPRPSTYSASRRICGAGRQTLAQSSRSRV